MLRTQNELLDSLHEGDILSSFRRRIWTLFGVVCVVVFLPGSVFILANGYNALAAGTLFLLLTFALNGYCLVRNRASQPAMLLFVVSLTFVVGLCLVQRGVVGIVWIFPAVLLINFLATGRMARVYTAGFFITTSAILVYALEPSVSVRAAVGLGVTIMIVNIFLEMIEKLQARLLEQSSLDPLTGALNRREMGSVLRDAIERKRRSRTPASLLVLDVDEFKSVNDTHGHAAGDSVLKELVLQIRGRMRHMDQLFRLGGEEFLIVLPDTPLSGATVFAEDLRTLVERATLLPDRPITISIGVSELTGEETAEEWLKRGDHAVYEAKNGGRNRIVGGAFVTPVSVSHYGPEPRLQVGETVFGT